MWTALTSFMYLTTADKQGILASYQSLSVLWDAIIS